MRTKRKPIEGTEYRLYGPPGTGKTTWIAKEARKALERYGEDQVSICSLTNTAIREVVGRDLPIDDGNVTTLHARCKRSLTAPAPAESRAKEFVAEFKKYADDTYLPKYMLGEPREDDQEDRAEACLAGSGTSVYEEVQIMRQQMIPMHKWHASHVRFHQDWSEWCVGIGHMDFTGWLETALEVRPLPAQQVVFIDEAQDHTPLQLAVIRSWGARSRVLVGDDDQNLYEWSGAIPDRFFTPELPAEREKVLEQSYRIPRAVHGVAMRWVKGIRNRRVKEYRPRDLEGSVVHSDYSRMDSYEGLLPPGLLEDPDRTYMILASCGYMLDGILETLRNDGIPYHNPYRRSNKRWNPLDGPGSKIRAYLSIKNSDRLWTGDEAYLWAGILKAKGVFVEGKKEEFLRRCELYGTKPIEGADLRECFQSTMVDRILKGDLGILVNHRKIGVPGTWGYALKVFSNPDQSKQVPRVIVGTVHSVKGGEADDVYLLPDLSPSGYMDYTGYHRDRVMRLFYVGMTRAKEKLILCRQDRSRAAEWAC